MFMTKELFIRPYIDTLHLYELIYTIVSTYNNIMLETLVAYTHCEWAVVVHTN